MIKKLKRKMLHSRPVKKAIHYLSSKPFPGYKEVSWYAVIEFFIRWVDTKDMADRASALSFTFFLALFPSVIFVFTLIAYLPFGQSHNEILLFFADIMPSNAYETIKSTLEDILKNQHSGLLSLGFISAMYFSTNGFVSLMNALNKYGQQKERRSFWKQRIVALLLALVVSLALLVSVVLVTVGNFSIDFLDKLKYFPSKVTPYLLMLLNYTIVAAIVLTIVSSVYYFAPSHTKASKWKFFSPGSIFACVIILLTTTGFSYYVNQFNSYNKVYGSIGVLIVVMMLIYINTYILLLGYEFNVAIDKTVHELKTGGNIKANRIIVLRDDASKPEVVKRT